MIDLLLDYNKISVIVFKIKTLAIFAAIFIGYCSLIVSTLTIMALGENKKYSFLELVKESAKQSILLCIKCVLIIIGFVFSIEIAYIIYQLIMLLS